MRITLLNGNKMKKKEKTPSSFLVKVLRKLIEDHGIFILNAN